MKGRRSRGVRFEDPPDDDPVKVDMRIEQRAKAVDEGHCADPEIEVRCRSGVEQGLLHDAQENAQRQRRYRRIVVQVITQALGNRQYPLPNRQPRKDVVGQVMRISRNVTGRFASS